MPDIEERPQAFDPRKLVAGYITLDVIRCPSVTARPASCGEVRASNITAQVVEGSKIAPAPNGRVWVHGRWTSPADVMKSTSTR